VAAEKVKERNKERKGVNKKDKAGKTKERKKESRRDSRLAFLLQSLERKKVVLFLPRHRKKKNPTEEGELSPSCISLTRKKIFFCTV